MLWNFLGSLRRLLSGWKDSEEEEVFARYHILIAIRQRGQMVIPSLFPTWWSINKSDIMEVFQNQNFHARGKFEKSLNATFISLIPKIPSHCGCEGFWPISLIGGVYKIIANVMANRLRVVLQEIISDFQNAFVKDRQIWDSVLIANE